jgi:cytoskeletal protein CcmA (bactofilin family)
MAIWKDPTSSNKEAMKEAAVVAPTPEPSVKRDHDYLADIAPASTRRTAPREAKESIISSDITITGKIDGAGHVRLAGKFEGDVHIQGDLTIESGAKLTGAVRANAVAIGGEVEGNIESAASVEILSTGVLIGDLKAGTLTVASGSRMRGRVEFGWGDDIISKSTLTLGTRQVS